MSLKIVLTVSLLLVLAGTASASSLEDQLCQAIKKNDHNLVKELITKGAAPTARFLEKRLPKCTKIPEKWAYELGKIVGEVLAKDFAAELKDQDGPSKAKPSNFRPASPQRTLGISMRQALKNMGHLFTEEKLGDPVDGLENHLGFSSDQQVQYQILGRSRDISRASLMIYIPPDCSKERAQLAMAVMTRFLLNTMPRWEKKSIIKWISDSMLSMVDHTEIKNIGGKNVMLSDHTITHKVANRQVRMSLPFMMLIVTVTPG